MTTGPLYLSIGNLSNSVRHAHCNSMLVLAFLLVAQGEFIANCSTLHSSQFIMIAEQKFAQDGKFQKFRCQLFHTSLTQILEPLQEGMMTLQVVCCSDGKFRHAIYGLGPYIADYPEQCLLSCVVQGWCPKYKPLLYLFASQ